MIKLSNRLSAVYEFAANGKKIIDVGTDHGYIPVKFALGGTADRIAASDVNPEPLERAKVSAKNYGVFDKIEFFLSDGLAACDSDFDTVIIAGMGGETIISILDNAKWTKSNVDVILQPQSKLEDLFCWLSNNGFVLKNARLVRDNGKLYVVLSVRGGEPIDKDTAMYQLILNKLIENSDPLLSDYLNSLDKKYSRALSEMQNSKNVDSKKLEALNAKLSVVRNALKEVSINEG
jgi:tRNA (adenine22-N1)-methyltransferase